MAEKEKKPILVLRERLGGASDALKDYVKNFTKIRKDLTAALKKGPRTVPDLVQETGHEGKTVLWHLMAMRRYGQLLEGKRRGDYYEYQLKEGV